MVSKTIGRASVSRVRISPPPRFALGLAASLLLLMGDLKVAPTPTVWAGTRAIDGVDSDWAAVTDASVIAVAGSSVNVAVVVSSTDGGTEWVWRDVPRDERRSAANPDNPSVDLTELRITGDTANLYLLARFRELSTSTAQIAYPIVQVLLDYNGSGSGASQFTEVIASSGGAPANGFADPMKLSQFRWEFTAALFQATTGTGDVFVGAAHLLKATQIGNSTTLTPSSQAGNTLARKLGPGGFIEASIPWASLDGSDKYLGKSVQVAAAVFWSQAAAPGGTTSQAGAFAPFEAGGSSATDVMSPVFDSAASAEGPAGYRTTGTGGTWAEVKDGKLGFAPVITFGANGNPVAPARPALNAGAVRVDGVPVTGGRLAEVITGRAPVFSWVLSSSGTIGAGAVRVQVGRDEAAVTAGSPDVWDAGVTVSTADSTVSYAGPALQAGTTYYWHLLYMDAAGTSSGWSPTGRFLALGAAVTIAAGDDLIVDWNNPFNPLAGDVTKLRYVVRGEAKRVTLRIYSITGGLVRTLEMDRDAAPDAVQSVAWDGRNEEGQIVASGMYLAHMTTIPEGTTITKKIVVVK